VTTSTFNFHGGKKKYRHCALYVGAPWDRPEGGEPHSLAIALAEKEVVEWVRFCMVVNRIGDAAKYSRFSLVDPKFFFEHYAYFLGTVAGFP
jgi:hypothetical protein